MELLVATVLAFLVGGLIAWIVRGIPLNHIQERVARLQAEADSLRAPAEAREGAVQEVSNLRESLARAEARLHAAEPELEELKIARKQLFDLGRDKAALLTRMESDGEAHAKQIAELTAIRDDIQSKFQLLATEVLKTSTNEFAERADRDISNTLNPIRECLVKYEARLAEIENARNTSYGAITSAVDAVKAETMQVRSVTANLVSALKAAPKTRARCAEESLRRVMEMSQMLEYCDFDTEKTFSTVDENLRPDAIITLAGGGKIIVDAKAPFSAYLQAIEASTEEEREALLKKHAAQLRERLTDLSSRNYSDKIAGSADCVVMFVGGDNFVASAFQYDPDLFQDGIDRRVLICTPTTFIALAKAISYGWHRERLAQSAIDIGKLGKELYSRMRGMTEHIDVLGTHLQHAVDKYNAFIGSFESRVIPQARLFNGLGVPGTSEPIQQLEPVDTRVRPLRSDQDLFNTSSAASNGALLEDTRLDHEDLSI